MKLNRLRGCFMNKFRILKKQKNMFNERMYLQMQSALPLIYSAFKRNPLIESVFNFLR